MLENHSRFSSRYVYLGRWTINVLGDSGRQDLSNDREEINLSETAERLMDLAEAHIRNAGYGGFSFRDLAAEIGIKSASCITISPPRPRWLPLLPGVTKTVS